MFILVTLAVLKPDTSSDVKPEQPENMAFILVIFEVSKPDTSSDVKPEQPENMAFILVIFEVLTPVKSIEVKPVQFLNVIDFKFLVRVGNITPVIAEPVASNSCSNIELFSLKFPPS